MNIYYHKQQLKTNWKTFTALNLKTPFS